MKKEELFKSRGAVACVSTAFDLFNKEGRQILKQTWMPTLAISLLAAFFLSYSIQLLQVQSENELTSFIIIGLTCCVGILVLLNWLIAATANYINPIGLKNNFSKSSVALLLIIVAFVIITCIVFLFKSGYEKIPNNWFYVCGGLVVLVLSILLTVTLACLLTGYLATSRSLKDAFLSAKRISERGWSFFLGVFCLTMIISLIPILLFLIPIIVISGAHMSIFESFLMNDNIVLPFYYRAAEVVTATVAVFGLLYVGVWGAIVLSFAFGSVEQRDREQRLQKDVVIQTASHSQENTKRIDS